MITKCPKCATTFNVRQEQLAAAKGLVRCGACMNIFNAIEHRAALSHSDPSQPSTPTTASKRSTQNKPDHQNRKINVKINVKNKEEEKKTKRENKKENKKASPKNSNANTKEKPSTKNDWANVMQADLHSIEQDLDELEKQVSPQRLTKGSSEPSLTPKRNVQPETNIKDKKSAFLFDDDELSESLRQLESKKETDPFSYETEDGLQAPEESWAKIMLEKMEQEKPMSENLRSRLKEANSEDSEITPETEKIQKPKPQQNVSFDTSKLDQDIAEFFVASDTVSDQVRPFENRTSRQAKHLSDLDDLSDEPVDLTSEDISQTKHQRKRRLIYGLVILLFTASVLAQYIYYNFNTLGKSAFWRPKLEYLCTMIKCQLPAVRDVSNIKSQNVVTRQHPDKKEMLIANAVIYSVSEVPVPFPNINLRFTDKDGRAIEEKQFSPKEYRKGDLLQLDMIPPNRVIHISIEMLDPGPTATSYTIHFSYD